ncbi:hypothetical protein NGI46_17625 [Peribacillus butanolivorans]|nr:hypothetical protein [Peribacillus butanolivorans]
MPERKEPDNLKASFFVRKRKLMRPYIVRGRENSNSCLLSSGMRENGNPRVISNRCAKTASNATY